MLEAHSLQSIKKTLDAELPREVTLSKKEPILEMQKMCFMTSFNTEQTTEYRTVTIKEVRNSKFVGILLAHPKAPLPQKEIIAMLPHFHMRSGEAIDFFCVGYGAYWPPEHYADQNKITNIQGIDWFFSEKAYSDVIDELEKSSKWEYSGETELLLMSAYKETEELVLDFSTAIVCNLEKMSGDGAFTSVRAFFEDLFKFAKKHSDLDTVWELSDRKGMEVGKNLLKDAVLSLLPSKLQESYKKAEHFAVVNIGKEF